MNAQLCVQFHRDNEFVVQCFNPLSVPRVGETVELPTPTGTGDFVVKTVHHTFNWRETNLLQIVRIDV